MSAELLAGALAAWPVQAWQGALLALFAGWPLFATTLWISAALLYRWQWESGDGDDPAFKPRTWPFVSVLVPAHGERALIARTVDAMLRMEYPKFEVLVIDDGSRDGTLAALAPLRDDPRLRVISKPVHEGKAMALNDALTLARGGLLLVLDADVEPDRFLLRHLVPHFDAPRVAAVTGQPRVRNLDGLLPRLRALDASASVSLRRRAQRVWGRMGAVSGELTCWRRRAVLDVGGFDAAMTAADVELAWRLQRRRYDIRYEPKALAWVTLPSGWRALLASQRRRARGQAQALRRHVGVLASWRQRRLWPLLLEAAAGGAWGLTLPLLLLSGGLFAVAAGLPGAQAARLSAGSGAAPALLTATVAAATLGLLQVATALLLDRRHDPRALRLAPYAIAHPPLAWTLATLSALVALPALLRPAGAEPICWKPLRDGAAD